MSKNKKKRDKPKIEPVSVNSSQQPARPAPKRIVNRNRSILIAAGLLVLLISAFFFFRKSVPGLHQISAGDFKGYNILLVTLDTTRADHLPVYGYKNVETPNLSKLAQASIVFDQAISQVPLTLPAHTSIMTGLMPIAHGVRDNGAYFVDEKLTTIAEVLKKNGYSTSAFVSGFVLDSRWKLNQGFDFYFDHFNLGDMRGKNVSIRDIQRRGDETENEAEQWLGKHGKEPFFSWVHFYDPHDPYDPPEPYKSKYADRPYDGEIAFTDDVVGRLLKKIEELKQKDRTIVVVVGDHGEGLMDHQELTHALFVYNTTQHIPLIIHLPGQRSSRVPGIVRQIDIAPTILELLGLAPVQEMQGSSMLPMMNGTEKNERLALSESIYCEIHYGWSPLMGLTTEKYKYIDAPKAELYDRLKDPGETDNLINKNPSLAKALKGKLDEIVSSGSRADLKGPQKMDPETEEKLRALGYLGSGVTATAESRKIDPKDKIETLIAVQEAFDSAKKNEFEAVLQKIQPALKNDPEMSDGHFVAGVAYSGLRQFEKAIDELLITLTLRPSHTTAMFELGKAYEQFGNSKEAEHWYKSVIKSEGEHSFAYIRLAHLYRAQNQLELAKSYFLRAIEDYQKSLEQTSSAKGKSAFYSSMAELYFGAGDLNKALISYKSAIELQPEKEGLHYNLAQIYEAENMIPEAIHEYQKEISVAPKNFKAFNDLGILYRRSTRWEDAISCFQKVVELLPDDPRGYILLGSTYQMMGNQQEAMKIRNLMIAKKQELKWTPEKQEQEQ